MHSFSLHGVNVLIENVTEECVYWSVFVNILPQIFSVVNQDGQPLIEGTLKEKQVRWKFIKRWKTRYFTLAGNQLLFRKGKSVSVSNPDREIEGKSSKDYVFFSPDFINTHFIQST